MSGAFLLGTDRLRLRPLHASDADALQNLYADREVARWLSRIEWPFTRTAAEAMVVRAQADLAGGRGWFLAIITAESNRFVGTVSLRVPARELDPWTTDARLGILGYAINSADQGNGYAFEAARCTVKFAFEQLQLERLRATVLKENAASRKVLERLGFGIGVPNVQETPRYGGPPRPGDVYFLERTSGQSESAGR